MAYTPTNWVTGDTISAEKLNKMENGIASSGRYDFVWSHGANETVIGPPYSEFESLYEATGGAVTAASFINGGYFPCGAIIIIEEGEYVLALLEYNGDSEKEIALWSDGAAINGTNANWTYDANTRTYTIGGK